MHKSWQNGKWWQNVVDLKMKNKTELKIGKYKLKMHTRQKKAERD